MANFDVQKGMTVYGSDGAQIGTVREVWSVDAYRHGNLSGHFPTQGEEHGDTGVHETEKTGEGAIFKVEGGTEGEAGQLFVPFGAIQSIDGDQAVRLCYTGDQASELFNRMPEFLQATIEG